VEAVASAYLRALADGDTEAQRRLGTVEIPPAIRSYREVRRDRSRDSALKGSFAPITAFHKRVEAKYVYNAESGRYEVKNKLGAAAATLDALHEGKKSTENSDLPNKIQSGNPEDIFDAAESLGKAMQPLAKLAETVLAPQNLLATYKQLVDNAKPKLPKAEKALALDYAADTETWNALLKRPFTTLKADGPYVLDRAVVKVSVVDALGSLGDPPRTLYLTLTRFRLEGIDTGWRVTSASRDEHATVHSQEPEDEPEKAPEPKRSPGEPLENLHLPASPPQP
jgi:hypothetical protein